MKRNLFYAFAFLTASAVVLSSCEKKVSESSVPSGEKIAVKAYCSSEMKGSERTSLSDPSTGTVVWNAGDDIKVFNDFGVGSVLNIESGAGTSSAVFAGEVETGQSNVYYSVTPSSSALSCSGSVITVRIPKEQKFTPGSYDSNACPFVASATLEGGSLNLNYRPAVSVVRFGLKGDSKVASIKIMNTSAKPLSGTFNVDLSSENPTAVAVEGDYEVYLRCTEPVQLNKNSDTYFYVTVPVGSFSEGMVFQAFDEQSLSFDISSSVVNTTLYSGLLSFSGLDVKFQDIGNTYWMKGDDNMVFSPSNPQGQVSRIISGFGTQTAEFEDVDFQGPYTTINPATLGNLTYNNGVVSFYFPDYQKYTMGIYDSKSLIRVCYINDYKSNHDVYLSFGMLRLNYFGEGVIKSIKITDRGGRKLNGTFSVNPSVDKASSKVGDDGTSSLVLDCGEGVELNLDKNTDFWLSVPPGVFTNGFDVEITSVDGKVFNYSLNEDKTTSAGGGRNIPSRLIFFE